MDLPKKITEHKFVLFYLFIYLFIHLLILTYEIKYTFCEIKNIFNMYKIHVQNKISVRNLLIVVLLSVIAWTESTFILQIELYFEAQQ